MDGALDDVLEIVGLAMGRILVEKVVGLWVLAGDDGDEVMMGFTGMVERSGG